MKFRIGDLSRWKGSYVMMRIVSVLALFAALRFQPINNGEGEALRLRQM